ncbi:MAG: hypothetical protein NUV85_04175 [Candidatus Berkelbacteria bacterium]|nr:hypothetical protein [Candidatus Berkelbacteria bacterium]
MKIHIPNSAYIGNIDFFLANFDASQPDCLEVTANEKWISVHPVALSMIAALSLSVPQSKITCEPITAKSAHYLDRMGLYKFLSLKSGSGVVQHEPSGRFVPLTQIKNSDELTKFLTDIIPLLHLSETPKHAESIRYIISELVRNVLEHSNSKYGAIVSAQYFKKTNTIRIGIADTGVGIKSTISRSYRANDDLAAIMLALTPGITGTTNREGGTEQNAGAGLFFIKSIASINRNFFMIYSGNALYKLLMRRRDDRSLTLKADPVKDRHSSKDDLPYWQGTVVGIDISLDATSEFTSLLDLIRNTFRKAVQDRRKARYKRARFI